MAKLSSDNCVQQLSVTAAQMFFLLCGQAYTTLLYTHRDTPYVRTTKGHNQIRPKSNIMYNKRVRVRMQVWRSLLGREPFGHVPTHHALAATAASSSPLSWPSESAGRSSHSPQSQPFPSGLVKPTQCAWRGLSQSSHRRIRPSSSPPSHMTHERESRSISTG